MTMTLEQVRDEIRNMGGKPGNCYNRWADALDAHIAAMGEPVAWQYRELGKPWRTVSKETYDRYCVGSGYECRTLFAAQPASGDWDKVREVIAILDADGDEWGCAAKLTAALPESQP